MKLQMSFGENLINLRKQKGWSQDDLADNLNLSRQAISKWENETSKPDIDNIEKISKLFSVTIDDLLNNDVVKDKAVTLNVKKQEKKEKTITIVKCMIIAVIILYIINVIFKFASLLIIVNGIQKYANLSNYHYVITTYDENGLSEKEECWFKDGVSKTERTTIENNKMTGKIIVALDFNKNYGYTENILTNSISSIDINEYFKSHKEYKYGSQFYDHLPLDIRKNNLLLILEKSLFTSNIDIKTNESKIILTLDDSLIVLNRDNLIPNEIFSILNKDNKITNIHYNIELYTVEKLEI